jgi:hypothetical protein
VPLYRQAVGGAANAELQATLTVELSYSTQPAVWYTIHAQQMQHTHTLLDLPQALQASRVVQPKLQN